MKVLWLAGWYPNPADPFSGDFIQRHAKAVALLQPLTVIYVNQLIPAGRVKASKQVNRDGALTEYIVSFAFTASRFRLADRLRFNLLYYYTCRRLIAALIREEGRPDLVHVHVPMKPGMVARWIKKIFRVPYIVSEHSTHYLEATNDSLSGRSRSHQRNVSRIYRDALCATNVSRFFAQLVRDRYNLQHVEVVHNTVDTALFTPIGQHNRTFTFIHVSTLHPLQKRPASIIRAFIRLLQNGRDAQLVVVGPATPGLQSSVPEEYRQRVLFRGELPYDGVAAQLQTADAFVLFSRFENFPCVLIEALCAGIPLIAADVGGVGEIINASNGILVAPDSEEDLFDALIRMMDSINAYNRTAIAREAASKYDYLTIGKQFVSLYERLI